MIRHICMFKLKSQAEGKSLDKNLQEAVKRLEGFEDKIETLRKFEVKINHNEAPKDNYELVLLCDFDDIAGLEAYRIHPDHVAFGKFINSVRELRACIDYEY